MANYWVITIGINQYRHLQPLMHAQNDALFTHRFFTEEAGVPSAHCVLLSDLATSVAQQVVYPDKSAIAAWLQTITQQVQADDVVWFFFSGYGAQAPSEQNTEGQNTDYLMPIDGDPGQIEKTGIALAGLIDTLAELPTNKTLLVLDINRSQGALAGQAIGTQIIDLAQKRQVSTLLSCQPEQYSHETLGVRHGLFTAALLEALQQNCKTPSQISHYLNQRLPELCEHHWRPIQNPVSILSEPQALAEVVPELNRELQMKAAETATVTDVTSQDVASQDVTSQDVIAGSIGAAGALGAIGVLETAESAESSESSEFAEPTRSIESSESVEASLTPPSGFNETPKRGFPDSERASSREIEGETSELVPAISGAKLRNWGLFALALLMAGVVLKQPFIQTAWDGLFDPSDTASRGHKASEKLGDSMGGAAGDTSGSAAVGEAAGGVVVTGTGADKKDADKTPTAASQSEKQSSKADEAGTKTEDLSAGAAATQAGSAETRNAEAKNTGKNGAPTAEEKASALTLIAQANAALSQKQYSEALIALQQVPKSQRDEKFSSVLTQARAGAAAAQQANASVLTEARTAIQPTQASQFTEAIAKARLIKSGEPYYEAAQEDIRSWSQVILDIAEGRATSGNLESAIAAAKVMPFDNAEYHQKAQDRIAFWQQRQQSRTVIADAQKIPKLGEASTYQQGIVKLREVPIEHPEYESAQRLADQWSESIFSIAQARAAQGREQAAIQAAVLVPAGTTAYEPTQQAIRRWREASGE